MKFQVAPDAPLPERIQAKQAEIQDYQRILRENVHSRWYDQGRRHLAHLEQELAELQAQASAPAA